MTTASTIRRGAFGPAGLLLLIGALSAFPPVSTDIYLPALPQLTAELRGTTAGGHATIAAFFVGMALGQLIYGPWSDRAGRLPPLLIGIGVYLLATLGCALSWSMPSLIGFRFIQAVGASAGVVVASAVVRDSFDYRESARVLSIMMLVRGLGPILAPLMGGVIVTLAGWRSVFWISGVFGVGVAAATMFGLGETRTAEVAARARTESPLRAYLTVLARTPPMAYILTGSLNFACLFAWIATAPYLVIGTFGVPALYFGLVFGLNATAFMMASQVNRALLKRIAPDRLLLWGAWGAVIAAAVLMLDALTGLGGPIGVLAPMFCVTSTLGFVATNAQAGALAVDPSRAGTVSSVFGSVQFALGGAAMMAGPFVAHEPARSMAGVILACALGALALPLFVLKGRGTQSSSA